MEVHRGLPVHFRFCSNEETHSKLNVELLMLTGAHPRLCLFMAASVYLKKMQTCGVGVEFTFIEGVIMCQGLHSIVGCHCDHCRLFEAGFAMQPWVA